MRLSWFIALGAAALLVVPSVALANSISAVEGARAKERQGRYLNRQDRDNLRRYGSNDDHRSYRYDYSYSGGYYSDPYGYGSGPYPYRSYPY